MLEIVRKIGYVDQRRGGSDRQQQALGRARHLQLYPSQGGGCHPAPQAGGHRSCPAGEGFSVFAVSQMFLKVFY